MRTAKGIRNRLIGSDSMFFFLLIVCSGVGNTMAAAAGPPDPGKTPSEQSLPDTAVAYDLKAVPLPDLPEAVRSRFTTGGSFARVREGLIQMGDTQRKVFLGYRGSLTRPFNLPTTILHILPADRPIRIVPSWMGGQQLSSTYRSGDSFYRFSATPAGDKLFVRRYEGPLGMLQIETGGRKISEMSIIGSVGSTDTGVLVSEERDTGGSAPVRSCQMPVGDYYPGLLNVTYDRLQFGILRNYHADGRPGGRIANRPQLGAIQIRADRPFVLDFSGKPQVLFALPAKDQRVQRGSTLSVKAVLIDPALDAMFRYLRQDRQLDPTVVIKRANGEIVTRGAMPFG